MVLCVKIDATRIANLRIERVRGTAVNVLDVAPLPVEFASINHALIHFCDLNNQPNNSVALKAPAALVGSIARGAKKGSVYLGFDEDEADEEI